MRKALLALFFVTGIPAWAVPIYFTFSGTITGTFNGSPITNEPFVFNATADTTNIGTDVGFRSVMNDSVTLSLLGNDYTVTTPTLTSVFHGGGGRPVLYNSTENAAIVDGPSNSIFTGWDLLSSLGPITDTGVIQVFGSPVHTSGGNLVYEDNFDATLTFNAEVAPEPSTLGFALLGFGALAALRRRGRLPISL